MKKIALLCILVGCTICQSWGQIPTEKKEIANATDVIASGEKRFKVITEDENISSLIDHKYRDTKVVSITMFKKEDKRHHEQYWQIAYYFNNEDYDEVVKYVTDISKPKKK